MNLVESICSIDELNAIRKNLSGSYRLDCDISISPSDFWLPIGQSNSPSVAPKYFTGKLDGNGHTITLSSDSGGLFFFLDKSAVVSNLKVNVSLTVSQSTNPIGAVAGWNFGRLENIQVSGAIQTAVAMTGGLVGQNYGLLRDVSFSGSIRDLAHRRLMYPNDPYRSDTYPGFIGGISGSSNGPIRGASVNADIYSAQDRVGLITGQLARANVENCLVNGSIQTNSAMEDGGARGGVVGLVDFTMQGNPTVIRFCQVKADLSGMSVGGIVGTAIGAELILDRNSFEGSISASRDLNGLYSSGLVGGLVALCSSCAPSVQESFVRAVLNTGSSGVVGGIFGSYYPTSMLYNKPFAAKLTHVFSGSIVNGGSNKGGLFGSMSGNSQFRSTGVFWDADLAGPNSAPLVWVNTGNWQFVQVDPGTGLGYSSLLMSSINTYTNVGYSSSIWDFSKMSVAGDQVSSTSNLPVTPVLKR